jgi:hypothetical protein
MMVTVLLDVATFFVLLDSPSTAKFFSDPDKETITQHVAQGTASAGALDSSLSSL